MPNRILREGILTSPRVARLSGWADEVFYRRLMSVVDDFGRYYADPGLLRAACYPRQLNKVSDSDIGKWLTACVNAALVRVYPASDGERYVQLIDFRQQARATKSKFPQPPIECAADATQVHGDGEAPAPVFVFEDVSGDGGEVGSPPAAQPSPPEKGKRKKPETAIPSDFAVSEAVEAWAATKGFDRLGEHLEAFRLKVAAKNYTYVDWDAAFMGAIRDDWAKLRVPQRFGAVAPINATVAENPQVEETRARLDADARRKIATPAEIAALKAIRTSGVTR